MIKIICVGKIKEKYFIDALEEYKKRLSKYTKLEIIEVNDYKTDYANVAMEREKELLLKHIDTKDYLICLDINGVMVDSIELSKKIDKILISNSNITFIIGGSCGLDDEIKKMCNYRLSFSKLTFPHKLFRIMLLEQIYRAFKIKNNESYHK